MCDVQDIIPSLILTPVTSSTVASSVQAGTANSCWWASVFDVIGINVSVMTATLQEGHLIFDMF